MKKFKCKLCGYIVQAESLDECSCPLCSAKKSDFEEILEDYIEDDINNVTYLKKNKEFCSQNSRAERGCLQQISTSK